MARRLRLLAVAIVAAAALAAFAVFGLASQSSPTARKAPRLPREQLSGAPVTLAGLLAAGHGRPLLVVFWASWCGPCAREAPAIERFAESAAGRGRVVGIDWSDALAGARAFIREHAWTFPNLRDSEGTVGDAYGLSDLPTTFVVDSSGHIRATLRGPQTVRTLDRALTAPT